MTMLQSFNAGLNTAAKVMPFIESGMVVKVHQKISEQTEKGKKERTQIFEGLIIAKRGTLPATCTITVRKISNGVGVERIFPLISPSVEKIEVVRKTKIRRAKLYYLRELRGKASKLKELLVTDKERKEIERAQAEEREVHAAKLAKAHADTQHASAPEAAAAPVAEAASVPSTPSETK